MKKQTGEGTTDVTKYGGVNFYAKYVAFKDNQYNDKHFRKLKIFTSVMVDGLMLQIKLKETYRLYY